MKLLHEVSDDEVITAFLKAELNNPRHFDKTERIKTLLKGAPATEVILNAPENAELRLRLLETARGWQQNKYLFYMFPRRVIYFAAELGWEDMQSIQYILYPYWNELSKRTRSPLVAAESIREDKEIYGQNNEVFVKVSEAAKKDVSFPAVILVKDEDYPELTIVEGHQRMTGFALAEYIPKGQKFYVGIGKGIKGWSDLDKS